MIATVVAFPRLTGSNDDPAYALATAFLALAVVFGIAHHKAGSENRRSKEQELVQAATEYAAGKITLEEYGSQTKNIAMIPDFIINIAHPDTVDGSVENARGQNMRGQRARGQRLV